MSVPLIGISYDPKIVNFLHMIGEEPVGTLDDVSADSLFTAVRDSLEDVQRRRRALERIRLLREESLKNAHRALALLSK